MISHQLWTIEIQLKTLKTQKNGVKTRLKWIRVHFMLIYKMTHCVNNIFGWSHMALLLSSIQSAIVFSNSFYRLINNYIDATTMDMGMPLNNTNGIRLIIHFKIENSYFLDALVSLCVFMVVRFVMHLFYINKGTTNCYKAVKLLMNSIRDQYII